MTEDLGPTRADRSKLRSRKIRNALIVTGSVIALAAVILLVSALSQPKRPAETGKPPVTEQVALTPSQQDYQDAMKALASGDTTAAVKLLERAVSRDGNAAAKKKLDELKPLPDEGSKETTAKPPVPGAFDKPVKDVGKLMPTAVAGFTLGDKTVVGPDAELPLDPATPAMASRTSRVLLSVHDRGSITAAGAYVKQHSSALYPRSHTTTDVIGATAQSGTNDAHLGAVLFSRGRFVFEVVVTATGDPSKVLDVAATIARTFPTEP